MIGLALALVLQPVDVFRDRQGTDQAADAFRQDSGTRETRVEIGPDLGFWSSRLGGVARSDGTSSPGTRLDLTRDLNLPASRGIPIYGGGTISISADEEETRTEVRLTAEYWSRQWKGSSVLGEAVVFEEGKFVPGADVDSRLRLASLDLAASLSWEDLRSRLLGGVSILLRGTLADLKISSATSTGDQEFGDLFWGVGLFGEYRPWELVFVGASAKGYTTFGSDFEAGQADLQAYAGIEWRFFRLEGGFRYIPYAESSAAGHSLHYDLYGGYVGLSLFIRF